MSLVSPVASACSSLHCDVVHLSLARVAEALTVLVCVSCTGDGGRVFKCIFERRPAKGEKAHCKGLSCQSQE